MYGSWIQTIPIVSNSYKFRASQPLASSAQGPCSSLGFSLCPHPYRAQSPHLMPGVGGGCILQIIGKDVLTSTYGATAETLSTSTTTHVTKVSSSRCPGPQPSCKVGRSPPGLCLDSAICKADGEELWRWLSLHVPCPVPSPALMTVFTGLGRQVAACLSYCGPWCMCLAPQVFKKSMGKCILFLKIIMDFKVDCIKVTCSSNSHVPMNFLRCPCKPSVLEGSRESDNVGASPPGIFRL